MGPRCPPMAGLGVSTGARTGPTLIVTIPSLRNSIEKIQVAIEAVAGFALLVEGKVGAEFLDQILPPFLQILFTEMFHGGGGVTTFGSAYSAPNELQLSGDLVATCGLYIRLLAFCFRRF